MKTCSHCGNEVMDEAILCVHCGCPLTPNANQQKSPVQSNKMKTALILNIIALIISFCAGFIYSGLTVDTISEAFSNFFSDFIVYGLFAFVATAFVLCVINFIVYQKNSKRTFWSWLYVIAVVAMVAYFAILSPVYFFTTICGSGVLFPVAPILQVIAAFKIIQSTK